MNPMETPDRQGDGDTGPHRLDYATPPPRSRDYWEDLIHRAFAVACMVIGMVAIALLSWIAVVVLVGWS